MWQRRVIIVVLTMTLAWPHASLEGTDSVNSQSAIQGQLAQIEKLMQMAQELRGHLNRSAFDPEALLDVLEFDSTEIFRFVNAHVAFEQYPGTLRGAVGTLSARAGNALDQSILLAKLLRDSGYDARVAGARLTEEQARELLRQMNAAPEVHTSLGDVSAIVETLKKYAAQGIDDRSWAELASLLREPPQPANSIRYETVQSTVDYLETELVSGNIQLGNEYLSGLVEEARDYYWVQFRDAVAKPWTDLHPAISEGKLLDMAPTDIYADAIPEKLQHRLRFQMFIEVKRGNKLEIIPISQPWERPVANLVAEPVVFGNLANSMLGADLPPLDLEVAMESAVFFAPVFRGQLPPGGRYFDLNGNIIDPMVANDAAAGVFKTIGEGLLAATSALSGDAAAQTLTGQWVEYTFIAPGGDSRTVRRTTFDRIGPSARASGKIPADLTPTTAKNAGALVQRRTFMVSPGRTSLAHSIDYGLEQMIETYPAISAILRRVETGSQPTSAQLKEMGSISAAWPGHLRLFNIFDGADQLRDDVVSYRSGTALVEHREGLTGDGSVIAAIDIVSNPRRSFRFESQEIYFEPRANITGGVWETELEGIVLNAGDAIASTAAAFGAAKAANIPTRVVKPGDPLSDLDLPPDALFHLQSDLSANYAVIVPESAPPGQMPGWWRVNLQTGETLGQLSDGRGQTIAEYLGKAAFGFSVGMLACGLVSCGKAFGGGGAENNARLGCCILANFSMFGIGYLVGMLEMGRRTALATVIGTSANELWDLALLAAVGSAAYDTMTMMVPVCQ